MEKRQKEKVPECLGRKERFASAECQAADPKEVKSLVLEPDGIRWGFKYHPATPRAKRTARPRVGGVAGRSAEHAGEKCVPDCHRALPD